MDSLVDLTGRIQDPTLYAGGAYGDIHKCVLSGTSSTVAVKSLRCFANDLKKVERLKKVLRRELSHWKRLGDHPNIVPLLGVVKIFGPVDAPVSPWMQNGTLHSSIDNNGETLTLPQRIRMLEGIASGLIFLHSKNVVHGDLTSYNVLIDERCRPRLIDFGLASAIGPLQPAYSYLTRNSSAVGATRWMAPEVLSGSELETSADMYSFGCVMLEVISGEVPWQGKSEIRVICLKIKDNRYPDRPVCAGLADRHWMLMVECWLTPSERPTAHEVLIRVAEL